jgi:DNA replication protein DnaC
MISSHPTRNIDQWAEWLKVEHFGDLELRAMVSACADWAMAFKTGQKPRWLSICGPSGTGKSHVCSKLWRFASGRSRWHSFEMIEKPIYWPEMIEQLRNRSGYELLREMKSWPVLFLDDIGAERDTTGFAAEQLNTLLGCRVDKWTLITSNLTVEQLCAIDPRISDRMIRKPNLFIEVNTVSYSLRGK